MTSVDDDDFKAFWIALARKNLTESQYLESILGPKHTSMGVVISVTFVYVTIFITGVLGNVITCTVIIKNKTMHTSTNYYLFNLAISDLILLTVGMFLKRVNKFQRAKNLYAQSLLFHVEKYDRANDRPNLAMLAINIGTMIDRGLDDNCGPILAYYTGPKIAPDHRPRITARVKPMIF